MRLCWKKVQKGEVLIFSPKSEPTGVKEITQLQINACFTLRWDSSNSKGLTMGAWKYLILYAKFMEFLPNKRKKKGDIFLLSFLHYKKTFILQH